MNKQLIYNKFNGHCAYCGAEITIKEMQIDHIIPQNLFKQYVHNKFQIPYFLDHLTESDVNHIDNLFPSCRSCNNYKNSNSLEYFRKMLNIMLNEKHEYLFKSKSKMQIAINMGCLEISKWNGIFYFETLKKK
jgi:5-methylcytosine-specific restriction endonuclease McrA